MTGPQDHQSFETSAELTTLWAYRPLSNANDPSALLSVLKTVDLRWDTFVWIAAEAAVARSIRDYIVDERGHPRSWTKTGVY